MQNSRMKTVSALAVGLLAGATTMLPGAVAAQEGRRRSWLHAGLVLAVAALCANTTAHMGALFALFL